MNLRQLTYFVCIAQTRSFSAAADRLHVAQSALSRHMKELEDELGGALLDRGPRGVSLTESGKVLLDRAKFILSQLDDARAEVLAHHKELTGTVRLMTPSSVGQLLFEPLVEHFSERFPRVRLEISEGLWDDAMRRLQAGSVDVAVMGGSKTSDRVELEPLGYEQMLLVGKTGDALIRKVSIDVTALVGLPLMMPAMTLDILRQFAPALAGRLEVGIFVESSPAIRALVAAGRGYAVVPRSVLLGTLETRAIAGVPIRGFEVLRQLGTLRGRPKSRVMQEVIAAIRREIASFVQAGVMRTPASDTPPASRRLPRTLRSSVVQ